MIARIAIGWFVFILFIHAAMAQVPGSVLTVSAFCLPGAPGLVHIRDAMVRGDKSVYFRTMTDKMSGCISGSILGVPPFNAVLVRMIGTPFFTPKAKCRQFVEFEDSSGALAVAWMDCKSTEV